jgi:hypothetical protein
MKFLSSLATGGSPNRTKLHGVSSIDLYSKARNVDRCKLGATVGRVKAAVSHAQMSSTKNGLVQSVAAGALHTGAHNI